MLRNTIILLTVFFLTCSSSEKAFEEFYSSEASENLYVDFEIEKISDSPIVIYFIVTNTSNSSIYLPSEQIIISNLWQNGRNEDINRSGGTIDLEIQPVQEWLTITIEDISISPPSEFIRLSPQESTSIKLNLSSYLADFEREMDTEISWSDTLYLKAEYTNFWKNMNGPNQNWYGSVKSNKLTITNLSLLTQ